MKGLALGVATALATFGAAGTAAAVTGGPTDGAMGLQPAGSAVAEQINSFHNLLLWIITIITLLVLALLVWVMVRYNRAANPTPKKFTHNITVEVIWTVVPVLILVAIAGFSFPLLFLEERIPTGAKGGPPAPTVTIKATGNTWNWGYSFPDYGLDFPAVNMLSEEDAKAQNRPHQLATDEPIYVPVGETVRMLVTSNDVIHSWTIPSFGIKEDAIPGRVNEGWFNAKEEGVYYGQCSELCGTNHAFMPIEIRAVPRAEFERWVVEKGGSLTPPASDSAAVPAAPAG